MHLRIALAVALSCSIVACGGDPAAPEPLIVETDDAGTLDAGTGGLEASVDAAETSPVDCKLAEKDGTICACTEVAQRGPILYLLLDRSGSMGETVPGTKRTKWSLVRSALLDSKIGALRRLGGRVSVAAAWFPTPSDDDACNAGKQVFAPERGSKATYDALEAKLASAIPRGATPTAASLRAVADAVAKLPKPVHVILATDGAPNCGSGPCDASRCTYNIERQHVAFESVCDDSINCCDPSKVSRGLGWKACLDDEAANDAARALVDMGVKVWVLGVPGTPPEYAQHLDALAVAGGAPRSGKPRYYAASEPTQESLAKALDEIAASAIDSCVVRLEEPVATPGVTNVLLDGVVVENDAGNGWTWTSPSTIELRGTSCTRVLSGAVGRIQVVVGCRTHAR